MAPRPGLAGLGVKTPGGAVCRREPLSFAVLGAQAPDGLRITTHNPEFEAQMRVARGIMKERRAVLHELAK